MHREFQPGLMADGHDHGHHDHDHDPAAELRALVATTIVVGSLLGVDLFLGVVGFDGLRRPFGFSLSLIAAVIGGGRVVYLAVGALLEGRIGADIALAVACVAAGLLGEYFVAAEVVFIALVGECLEAFTFERARRSIEKLLEYRPRTARIVRDGSEVEIPADSLVVGDRIVVRPGERIAADGVVISGRSAVDQAILTGEGLPVDKGEGDPVFTGSMNQFGRLEIQAQKVGSQTTLGQVIRLLGEARKNPSTLERTADRYARLFLPTVLSAASIVFLGTNAARLWGWWRSGISPAIDLLPTLAVLVVACPCALILATPAAVLAATSRLARRGVLVKGGAALERLARVDTIAFDKTGTLTEGRPEIGDVEAFDGHSLDEILSLAAAAERPSEHPLARLVVAEAAAKNLPIPEVDDFEAKPGSGVSASIRGDGRRIFVGNARLVREQGIEIRPAALAALKRLDDSGQTSLLVAVDGLIIGVLGARDKVRAEAHDVIHDLKHLGLKDLTILTGDRPSAARSVAKKVHIKQVEAERTPIDKAEWVQTRKAEGRIVAMIGDGINDAPALAAADVGIALGGVGADIAAEAGSIVLMGAPLEPLPEAVKVARETVKVIRQNILIFAFGLNAVAVLLAGLRVLGPVPAAILHQIGSLLVLLNAIRLLGFDRWRSLGLVRGFGRFAFYCRSCRPSNAFDWAYRRRRGVISGAAIALVVIYATSGIVLVGPSEVGLLQRFGRYRSPSLASGLHVRWPIPFERVTKVEPDLVRVARIGPAETAKAGGSAVVWGASHGPRREESTLFFTGDENLVELSGIVEYRLADSAADLVFGVESVDEVVLASSEGAFREVVGRTALESILAKGRREFESDVEATLRDRFGRDGLKIAVDRVRVIDAHPPREVVPAYRDVAAAVSDAGRFKNEAEAYAAERDWSARGEAKARRDAAEALGDRLFVKAKGDKLAFVARVASHTDRPDLTEFRLLFDALASAYAGRPKLILDPRAGGRRQVWLADPERLGFLRTMQPPAPEPIAEPVD